jgi:hypothetical protein
MVDIAVVEPAYSEVMVVNSPVTGVDIADIDVFSVGT